MKKPLFVLPLIILSACAPSSSPPGDADTKAIQSLILEGMPVAWAAGDKDWFGKLDLDNADLTFPTGPWISGKPNMLDGLVPQPAGRKMLPEIQDLRFIGDEVALVNVNAHFTGGTDAGGRPLADYWDAGTHIFQKVAGEWKLAALRVMPMRVSYEEVKAAIDQGYQAFAQSWKSGDSAGAAGLFTEDAINTRPGAPEDRGRAVVKTMSDGWLAANTIEELTFTTLELEVAGPKAFEYGAFEQKIVPKSGGKPFLHQGRYNAVWRRDVDGVWRIHRFLFNDAPAN